MTYNIVHYDNSSNSIQKFTSSDLTDLAEVVLEYMAAGTYTGSITIGTSNPIGTFTDTVLQGAIGSSDITVLSNTYTLSQVNTTTLSTETDPPKYMGLEVDSTTVTIQENSTTLSNLADEIISHMVNGGSNSYYLGTSAPSDGGTWVSLGTLLNTLENFTVTVDTYHLWKKTSSGSVISYKNPLKLSSGNLQKFTLTDIEKLAKIIEQRIIATEVGTYVLQSVIPGTGVWSSAGTVTDTRRVYTGAEFDGSSFDSVYTGENPDGTSFASPYYYVYYYNPVYSASFGGGPFYGPPIGYVSIQPVNFVGDGTPVYTGTAGMFSAGGSSAYTGPGGTFGSTGYVPTTFTAAGPAYAGPVYNSAFYGPPAAGYGVGYNYYLGPLVTDFSGPPSYTQTYTSIAVGSSTEIITTATLWKRVG